MCAPDCLAVYLYKLCVSTNIGKITSVLPIRHLGTQDTPHMTGYHHSKVNRQFCCTDVHVTLDRNAVFLLAKTVEVTVIRTVCHQLRRSWSHKTSEKADPKGGDNSLVTVTQPPSPGYHPSITVSGSLLGPYHRTLARGILLNSDRSSYPL